MPQPPRVVRTNRLSPSTTGEAFDHFSSFVFQTISLSLFQCDDAGAYRTRSQADIQASGPRPNLRLRKPGGGLARRMRALEFGLLRRESSRFGVRRLDAAFQRSKLWVASIGFSTAHACSSRNERARTAMDDFTHAHCHLAQSRKRRQAAALQIVSPASRHTPRRTRSRRNSIQVSKGLYFPLPPERKWAKLQRRAGDCAPYLAFRACSGRFC